MRSSRSNPTKGKARLLAGLLLLGVCLLPPRAAAETPADLKPPFGLNWGESTQRMQTLISSAKGKITSRGEYGGRMRWVVDGLDQKNLKQAFFYFEQGGLTEVELEYQNPTWNEEEYNVYLRQLRAKIVSRFGPGQLLTRTKAKVEDDIVQTVVGYRWSGSDTILELLYFSAEKKPQTYYSVSLLYRVGGS